MNRSQDDRIHDRLKQGGLCAMEPLEWEPPITRVAARIHGLTKKGIVIDAQHTCPEHDGARHAYYHLPLERLF